MRISVVEFMPEGSRAATLQRALRAIDMAAERDPAPDLVVLPLWTMGTLNADLSIAERIEGPTCAAFGSAAKSWGVHVAYGTVERDGHETYSAAVLLDSDGDIRLVHRQSTFHADTQGALSAGKSFSAADTLYGRIAVLAGDDLGDENAWAQLVAARARLIVGCASWGGAKRSSPTTAELARKIATRATTHLTPVVIADLGDRSAATATASCSSIIDASGRAVSTCVPGAISILSATLEIGAPS